MRTGERVSASTVVAVDPSRAFQIFTEEIDLWWRRDPRYRPEGRPCRMRFEPGQGGRLLQVYDEASGDVFEIGRISIWKPGERLCFEWRAPNFDVGETTEVEVRFEPIENGTRVSVEHRGFEALPADHPVRHGLEGGAFGALFGVWWGDLLVAYRGHARPRNGISRSAL